MNGPLIHLLGWLAVLLTGAFMTTIYKQQHAPVKKPFYGKVISALYYSLIILMMLFLYGVDVSVGLKAK